ncbi:MAG: FAD-binding protein [candidate division Zixibacteria bacterium]|nr:FAD-binding protein [candidate division Zixibacteria bacterium]
MIFHDILIIGGGLAGLRAAIAAAEKKVDVGIVTKLYPPRSHSGQAQGGINAALANNPKAHDDTPEKHGFDTVKGSDYLADQEASIYLTQQAPEAVFEIEHWGCPFSRTEEGKIAQRPFGGAGYPRTCYGTDKTGHYILQTLFEQTIKHNIKTYNEWVVIALAKDVDTCCGVIALNMHSGELQAMGANAVVFATGGSGRMYGNTTNAIPSTAFGVAMPYWAGVPLKDVEFVQFHPTSLYPSNILMTEGCRGEGGILVNKEGDRFMKKYIPKAMELGPRDMVARSVQTEILEGRGFEDAYVYLDLRHLGKAKIMERLPGIREITMDFNGIDPIKEPIPIQPGTHYYMGGIDVNIDGASPLKGFYAAGECACVSVHGANRLGGNSLLETVVFGKRAGASAGEYVKDKPKQPKTNALERTLKREEENFNQMLKSNGNENPYKINAELRKLMPEKAGLFRDEKLMTEGLEQIKTLKERFKKVRAVSSGSKFNLDKIWFLEIKANLDVAEALMAGGLARKESRGSHYRTDFPKRDDVNWLKHTIATYTPEGPKLSYSEVQITKYQPQERKY